LAGNKERKPGIQTSLEAFCGKGDVCAENHMVKFCQVLGLQCCEEASKELGGLGSALLVENEDTCARTADRDAC
jgi:hypothetical protein